MKTLLVALTSAIFFATMQAQAFSIQCVSENNLDVSQYGFSNLIIESSAKGNFIQINGKTEKLGETLPIKLNHYLAMTQQAESFTIIKPLQFGDVTLNAGTSLSYVHNRMELEKYRDTVVTFIDFGHRIKIDIDCQFFK